MPKAAGKKATAADADIVMKLYDLRREAEMRKARNWYAMAQFNSAEDVMKLSMNFGSQENAWFRQVLTYWENAASLVLRGAVNRELFMDWNGEMIFTYVKLKPFLPEIRKARGTDEVLPSMHKLLNSTPEMRKRVQQLEEQLKKWNEMRARAAAKS